MSDYCQRIIFNGYPMFREYGEVNTRVLCQSEHTLCEPYDSLFSEHKSRNIIIRGEIQQLLNDLEMFVYMCSNVKTFTHQESTYILLQPLLCYCHLTNGKDVYHIWFICLHACGCIYEWPIITARSAVLEIIRTDCWRCIYFRWA